MKGVSIVLLVLVLANQAIAQECSKQQAYDAETNAANLKSWEGLKEHFLLYGHCDDGAIGEGYSESVSYLMEFKWTEFLALEMDEKFSNFIQLHVDELWELNRYKRVVSFAKSNCNKSKETICQKIIDAE